MVRVTEMTEQQARARAERIVNDLFGVALATRPILHDRITRALLAVSRNGMAAAWTHPADVTLSDEELDALIKSGSQVGYGGQRKVITSLLAELRAARAVVKNMTEVT